MALEFCQRAQNEDNLLEEAYRLGLRIYAAMGNRAAMVRFYQRCVDVLEKEINSPPSAQTQALYQELLQ
jgi:DNA-binding SARP family transcriptional activator